jgi:hypothetical protein
MAMLTQIARLTDGLILAEEMDSDGRFEEAEYRSQAKKLFKTFNRKTQEKMTIESGKYLSKLLACFLICPFYKSFLNCYRKLLLCVRYFQRRVLPYTVREFIPQKTCIQVSGRASERV